LRILCGASVRQDAKTLAAHLKTMKWQKVDAEVEIDLCYVNDLDPDDDDYIAASGVLFDSGVSVINTDIHERPTGAEYVVAEDTHHWQVATFEWLAQQKQKLLDKAKEDGYDAVWLVDTDLLCGPETLQSLIDTQKPIVSGVFWTRWTPDSAPLPQVWLAHPYQLTGGRVFAGEEYKFLRRISNRELIEVQGLGACTFISTEVLDDVKYWPYLEGLPTGGMWQGEDRHFCVRANRNHISLFADAWPDIYHVYRPSDRNNLSTILNILEGPRTNSSSIANLVSFSIEPLEEPAYAGHDLYVRGRLGQLKILPELEIDLQDLLVRGNCITRLHFPMWYPTFTMSAATGQQVQVNLQGQTKLVRLTLLDSKPYLPHIGLNTIESDFSNRYYTPTQIDVMRRSKKYAYRHGDATKNV